MNIFKVHFKKNNHPSFFKMSLTYCHISVQQDQLAADMYSFFSKEGDYAHYFVTVSAACQPVRNV